MRTFRIDESYTEGCENIPIRYGRRALHVPVEVGGQASLMLDVLQSSDVNLAARETMKRRGISVWPTRLPRRFVDLLRLRRGTVVGDLRKSWDVLRTIELLEARSARNARILDLGAYASEVLCSLHLAGFDNLVGIDLNPAVRSMPFADAIQWQVGDMMATRLAGGSIAAITAISAIEHGVDLRTLFREVSRLLEPGGLFIASTDYWPGKIETTGIRMYGLEWTIFSRGEIETLLEIAAEHDLVPLGPLQFDANEAAIECAGRNYTFAWLALVKSAR